MLFLKIILAILALPFLAGMCFAAYYLLSLPFRRQERARLFLDLIRQGLEEGRKPEDVIQALGHCHDKVLGPRFHLVASHLERGESLERALALVPRMLPPQVTGMLAAGREVGDLRRVLPACHQLLRDAGTQVRKAQNYLILLAFVISPWALAVVQVLNIWVFPKMNAIAEDMTEGMTMPFSMLMAVTGWWSLASVAIFGAVWAGAVFYVGGAGVKSMVNDMTLGLYDRVCWHLPWQRKRIQRDFTAMLAILLDAGMPEERAIRKAAGCTANRTFERRATRVAAELQRGVTLAEAVRQLDNAGEFQWRLANAVHGGGFARALAGWQESLAARAFQQEQAVTHVLTSALVLWNGLVVAAVCWSVYYFLTSLIWEGILW